MLLFLPWEGIVCGRVERRERRRRGGGGDGGQAGWRRASGGLARLHVFCLCPLHPLRHGEQKKKCRIQLQSSSCISAGGGSHPLISGSAECVRRDLLRRMNQVITHSTTAGELMLMTLATNNNHFIPPLNVPSLSPAAANVASSLQNANRMMSSARCRFSGE